jgi:hypothetical protein
MALAVILLVSFAEINALTVETDDKVIERVRRIVEEIRANSYPELKGLEIEIKLFDSKSDYFRTRFTFTSFLFGRNLRYVLRVNRNVFSHNAPEDGLRAIVAHELGHIAYFKSKNRVRHLCLIRLATKGFTARFERRTDLKAIAQGFGEGLKSYRQWLYGQIPSNKLEEKKRNYFSPEEIDAILLKLRRQPSLLRCWLNAAPRSLSEIEERTKCD